MLLHLCSDEKFIDHVINMFETVAPNQNIYYIGTLGGDDEKKNLTHIKTKHRNIIVKSTSSDWFKDITENLSQFDAIICHNLFDDYKYEILQNKPSQTPFHWMCWGGDLYSIPILSKNLYLKKTKKLNNEDLKIKAKLRKFLLFNFYSIFNIANKALYKKELPEQILKSKLKNIDSVSTVIPYDYALIKKYINPSIKYKPFKYLTIENTLGNQVNQICTNNNILIGNSATRTNNHLEAFDIVSKITKSNQKIIVPLSYGDNQYANYIQEKGNKMFSNSFIALNNFLPLQEYNKILNSCGNVVMNHIRQQALGNIIISLWKGAHVFLNKRNPVYMYLKSIGIIVYEINDIYKLDVLPDFNDLAQHNRKILNQLYSNESVLKETKNLVNYLSGKSKTD